MTQLPGIEIPGNSRETERTMLDRLRIRYGQTSRNGAWVGRQYVVAEHVPSGLNASAGRIADAIVLDTRGTPYSQLTDAERDETGRGLWGNRQSIHGFEVKVSRSDWLTELADPSKALAWSRYCHYFWLVASDKRIVRDDLPHGWGLMIPHGRSLRIAHHPTRQDIEQMPLPTFVSLTRAIQRTEVDMATHTHPSKTRRSPPRKERTNDHD